MELPSTLSFYWDSPRSFTLLLAARLYPVGRHEHLMARFRQCLVAVIANLRWPAMKLPPGAEDLSPSRGCDDLQTLSAGY